jgi:hypothetical protein
MIGAQKQAGLAVVGMAASPQNHCARRRGGALPELRER